MSFIHPSREGLLLRRRRGLSYGDPGVWKTSCLLDKEQGLPRPIGIISFPGEKGYDSIPLSDPEIIPFIWETKEDEKKDSFKICTEVMRLSLDLIAGKYGKINSLIGDGIHKLFPYHLDMAQGGGHFAGEEIDKDKVGSTWYRAYASYLEYMDTLSLSNLPVVWFTCWAEFEGDRQRKQGERASDIPSHIYPALPGKLAKRVVGEFSIVVHQTLQRVDGKDMARWQTRPKGEVHGATIKGPKDLVEQIPDYIPASYKYLDQLWTELEAK